MNLVMARGGTFTVYMYGSKTNLSLLGTHDRKEQDFIKEAFDTIGWFLDRT